MSPARRPIALLADSQLLFRRQTEPSLLERLRGMLPESAPRAAYVGAANGDLPEYFELFRAAAGAAGIEDCRMILSRPSADDRASFDAAHLILLAGGDPRRGWEALRASGLGARLAERREEGCLLVGISAGAVLLGLQGFSEGDEKAPPFAAFGLVPYLVDVHDEPGWSRLEQALRLSSRAAALGVPSGGGALFHADGSLEPLRRPLTGLRKAGGEVQRRLLPPPATAARLDAMNGR